MSDRFTEVDRRALRVFGLSDRQIHRSSVGAWILVVPVFACTAFARILLQFVDADEGRREWLVTMTLDVLLVALGVLAMTVVGRDVLLHRGRRRCQRADPSLLVCTGLVDANVVLLAVERVGEPQTRDMLGINGKTVTFVISAWELGIWAGRRSPRPMMSVPLHDVGAVSGPEGAPVFGRKQVGVRVSIAGSTVDHIVVAPHRYFWWSHRRVMAEAEAFRDRLDCNRGFE